MITDLLSCVIVVSIMGLVADKGSNLAKVLETVAAMI